MKEKVKRVHRLIFHSNNIFTQLALFTAVVSIVPIIFISLLLFHRLSVMVTDELVNSHYQLAAQYMSNLDGKFFQYQDSLKQISNNTIILNTLMDKTNTVNPYVKGLNVSAEANKSLYLDSVELRNCMIYSDVESSKIYGSRVAMTEGSSREIWYLNKRSLNEDSFIYNALNGKGTVLSLVRNINYTDLSSLKRRYIGFIKLDLFMERLFAPTLDENDKAYSYDVIVLDNNDDIVYSSSKKFNDILSTIPFNQLQNNRINYYKNAMVCTGRLNYYGLKLLFLFSNSQLDVKMLELQRSILPILLLVLVIIVFTAFVFTRGFSRRVAKLINKIKVAETGDLSIGDEIKGNDEIAVLDRQFNQMLLKLDTLIKKNYVQQLEKKESEFRNLQLQINPHFLYNTLETISSIAAMNRVFAICDLCEKLGENFRYSLGKNYGEFVTVMQELQHTQNYVYIQKTRFDNKFEVFYNVDSEVENKLILRFILQPIVENAIVHGLSNITGKGTLEISIHSSGEALVIKIEDDGIGMPPEKVEEISRYINSSDASDKKRQSIGIRNVNQRIKLACGNEYGVLIESTQGRGSCFTIYLPLLQ